MLLGISNGNVVFGEKKVHEYSFRGKTTIIAPTGTEEGISAVSITGTANVIGTIKCGAFLYLTNLKIIQGSKVSVFSFAESTHFFLRNCRNITSYFCIFWHRHTATQTYGNQRAAQFCFLTTTEKSVEISVLWQRIMRRR